MSDSDSSDSGSDGTSGSGSGSSSSGVTLYTLDNMGSTGTAEWTDNGWDVTNVGTVGEVADEDVEYGEGNSSTSSSTDLELSPLSAGLGVAALAATFACLIWMGKRRQMQGFDDEFNGC